MRVIKRSVRPVIFCAAVLVAVLGAAPDAIDRPVGQPTHSTIAAAGAVGIDWPVARPTHTTDFAAGGDIDWP